MVSIVLLKTTLWPNPGDRRTRAGTCSGARTCPGPEAGARLMARGTLCSALAPEPSGGPAGKNWLFGNTSASASEHWVMNSIALITVMLYLTQCMQYCYYYKWIYGIMNNVGLLGRTQCWLVVPEEPDVTIYDCDWAWCLFWEYAYLYFSKVPYSGAKFYKASYWKKPQKLWTWGKKWIRIQAPNYWAFQQYIQMGQLGWQQGP